MKNATQFKHLFYEAVKAVPYDLTSTGATTSRGFKANKDGSVDYSEEFTFPISRFFDEKLSGICCISLWQSEETIEITGSFVAVLNEDWNSPHTLPEDANIQGEYDLETKRWHFEVYH